MSTNRIWNSYLLQKDWKTDNKRFAHTDETEVAIPELLISRDHPKKDRLISTMLSKYSLLLPLLPPNGHIVDACAGAGFGSAILAHSGYKVTAMDAKLKWAKFRDGIDCAEMDLFKFSLDTPADAVVMIDAVEHFKKSHQVPALQHLYNSLKPEGLFLIDTPRVFVSGRQGKEHPSCLSWEDFLSAFLRMGEWKWYQRYLIRFEAPNRGSGFSVLRRVLGNETPEYGKGYDQVIIGRKSTSTSHRCKCKMPTCGYRE